MKKTLLALIFVTPAAVAQQGTTPAQSQSATPQQPAERPVLKLRLNDIDQRDRRSIVGAQPVEEEKKKSGPELPGLGGAPSRSWNAAPETTVPKDQTEYR